MLKRLCGCDTPSHVTIDTSVEGFVGLTLTRPGSREGGHMQRGSRKGGGPQVEREGGGWRGGGGVVEEGKQWQTKQQEQACGLRRAACAAGGGRWGKGSRLLEIEQLRFS